MSESASVENKEQAYQKPPLSAGGIAGEILAGIATGVAVGLAVALGFFVLMGPIASAKNCFGGLGVLGGAVLYVFPAAYGLGSGIGVYLIGAPARQTGSFLLTLGCGFAGGLGAIAILPVPVVGVMLLSLTPPILATLGFNATRRYKAPPLS